VIERNIKSFAKVTDMTLCHNLFRVSKVMICRKYIELKNRLGTCGTWQKPKPAKIKKQGQVTLP
jgi:hypothetical protein